MKILGKLIYEFLRLIFRSKHDIVLENLVLRHHILSYRIYRAGGVISIEHPLRPGRVKERESQGNGIRFAQG